MSQMKITMQGLQVWLRAENDDLFSKMTLPETIDRETLIDTIFLRCAEFPMIFTNPYFVRDSIGVWSKKNYATFARWQEALTEEYNPLHNYDRNEEWTDSSEATGEQQEDVSAYDSTSFQPNAKNTSSGTSNATRKGRAYGNIGVTTSATMLVEEIGVRSDYNIYNLITESFADEFCVKIY